MKNELLKQNKQKLKELNLKISEMQKEANLLEQSIKKEKFFSKISKLAGNFIGKYEIEIECKRDVKEERIWEDQTPYKVVGRLRTYIKVKNIMIPYCEAEVFEIFNFDKQELQEIKNFVMR